MLIEERLNQKMIHYHLEKTIKNQKMISMLRIKNIKI